MSQVTCKQCGSDMKKTTKGESNIAVQVLGVIVFFTGLALVISVVFWWIGVPLMIAALFMGYKKKKVWQCKSCGYFFERA